MSSKPTVKVIVSFAIMLLPIPMIILLTSQMGPRKYYLISLAVVILGIFSFFLSFENRKPQAKEIILIAVMCGIAVAGRAAFIAIPFFKPIAALVIITGIALGAQAGFLCGSISMLVSNFLFGQGSWTPWQMAAFGAIGLIAGAIFFNKPNRQKPLIIAIFGTVVVLFIAGPILDMSGLFTTAQLPDLSGILSILWAGFLVNSIQAGATLLFLLLLGKPMLLKLNRVRAKYGMMG